MNYITYLYQKRNIKSKFLKYLEESVQTLNFLIPTYHSYFNHTLYSNNFCLENKNNKNNELKEITKYKDINISRILNRLLIFDKLCLNNIQLKFGLRYSSDDENVEIDNDFVWKLGIKHEKYLVRELMSCVNEKTKSKMIISNAILLEELELELEDENENSYIENKIESYIDFYFIKISTLNEFIKKRINQEIKRYKDSNSAELEMNGYKYPLYINGAEYLSFCFFSLKNIKLLDISWCGIEDEGFKFICYNFNKIKNLEKLHSCCNRLTDIGVQYFCDNCQYIEKLVLLDLRCNIISLDGCDIISNNIAKCPNLCSLWLDRDIFNNSEDIVTKIKTKHPNKDLDVSLSNVFTGFI